MVSSLVASALRLVATLRMNKTHLGLVLVAVAALSGCSDHPVDRLFALAEALDDETCACPWAADEDYCTMPDGPTSAEIACIKSIYDRNEAQVQPFLSCASDAASDVLRCFDRGVMCDVEAYSACYEAYEPQIDACPGVPVAIEEMLNDCTVE